MKKEKLIKLLSKLPAGTDVFVWNGYVGDYNDIDTLLEEELVKQTFESWLETLRLIEVHKHKNWDFKFSESEVVEFKKEFRQQKREWKFRNQFMSEDGIKSQYKTKKACLINMKPRGKIETDRMGKISY